MAGLHVEEENPGFTHVTIAPQPDYRITSCDMTYHSIAGTYKVNWLVEKSGEFKLHVEIPFGAAAKIVFPNTGRESEEVAAGCHDFAYMPEVSILKVYSSQSPFSELLESPKALAVVEQFIPGWQAVPVGMRDMTVEAMNGSPFVNLTAEQMKALNSALKNC